MAFLLVPLINEQPTRNILTNSPTNSGISVISNTISNGTSSDIQQLKGTATIVYNGYYTVANASNISFLWHVLDDHTFSDLRTELH